MQVERKIKGLKSQAKKLKGDMDAFKIQISNMQREYSVKEKNYKSIQKQIESFETDNQIRVSEHALIRYFERKLGYDIDIIKKVIVDGITEQIGTLGTSGEYVFSDLKAVVKDNVVITIH